jgi:methyl-accepting chemotaxis protein
MRSPLLALAAPALLVAIGCGPSKVAECNRLVAVVNQGVASLDQGMKAGSDPSGVAELRSMADAMEKAAVDAGKVELTISELKDFSKRYQDMAREVAKSAQEMAAAVDAKDAAKMAAAQEAMEKAVKSEDALVEGINKFCGGG